VIIHHAGHLAQAMAAASPTPASATS